MSELKCKFMKMGKCGSFKGETNDVFAKDLERNCKNHLVTLKLLKTHQESTVTERNLIQSRTGVILLDNDLICPYHRNRLGTSWRNALTCFHPNHTNKKKVSTRPATLEQIEKLCATFPEKYFPIGNQLCMTHLKEINQLSLDNFNSISV